jgi:hypothetical protein
MFARNIAQEITFPATRAMQAFEIARPAGLAVIAVENPAPGKVQLTFFGKQKAYDMAAVGFAAAGLELVAR